MCFPSDFTPLFSIFMGKSLRYFSPITGLNPVNERNSSLNVRPNFYITDPQANLAITCGEPMSIHAKRLRDLHGVTRPSRFTRANLADRLLFDTNATSQLRLSHPSKLQGMV